MKKRDAFPVFYGYVVVMTFNYRGEYGGLIYPRAPFEGIIYPDQPL